MHLLSMILRSLFRHPGRLLLGVTPMGLAFFGFAVGTSLEDPSALLEEINRGNRIVVINRQSIMQPLPQAHAARIGELKSVSAVTYATWFGGYYRQPENRFSQYAVEPDGYFDVYPEIGPTPEARKRWRAERRAAFVSERVARRFDWREGDQITLTSTIWQRRDGRLDWTFVIVGIIPEDRPGIEPEMLLFRHDYFDEGRRFGRGTMSQAIVRIPPGTAADAVIASIDRMFENGRAPTLSASEGDFVASFQRQLGDLGLLTWLVVVLLVLVVLLIGSSALAQAIAEREREFAVMGAIGFSRRRIALHLVIETVLSVLLAALAALIVSVPTLPLLQKSAPIGALMTDGLGWRTVVKMLGLAILLGLGGSLFPLVRHMRARLAAGLRE